METLRTLPAWQLALAALCAIFLLVAIVTFFSNERRRAAIAAALDQHGKKPLAMFDLAHGDAEAVLQQKSLVVPERLWTYDRYYLDRFAAAAHASRVHGSKTALALYAGPTLNWDIVFAVALGLFVALAEFSIAAALFACPLLSGAVLVFAGMGLVYGAADVAEDLKLVSILKDWQRANARSGAAPTHVDGGEAAAANALTRIKLVAVTLSVGGVAIFAILSVIAAAIAYFTPHDPTPAPSLDDPAVAT